MSTSTISSKHGQISVTDTGLHNSLPALLLLHGNSSSSKIFRHILASPALTSKHRLITFDLPGHGASSDAPDPDASYSMGGYSELAVEILQHLQVEDVIVFGWSLGGHIGIEMIPLLKPAIRLKGLLMVGTPPVLGIAEMSQGFTFTDGHMSVAGKQDFSEEEIQDFSRTTAGALFEQWMEDNVRRCDGRSRFLMWKKLCDGVGVDQRHVVENWSDGLLGVVNGAEEPFINLDYLDGINWKRLWKGKCVRLDGQGHAPFWEKPEEFERVLDEFVGDCVKG